MRIDTTASIATQAIENIDDIRDHPEKYIVYPFPIIELNQLMHGGKMINSYVLVQGRAKSGKSCFLLSDAMMNIYRGRDVDQFLYVSLEEDPSVLALRMLSFHADVDRLKMLNPLELTKDDMGEIYKMGRELSEQSIGYWTGSITSSQQLIKVLKDNPDIWQVYIDYAQIFGTGGGRAGGNRAESVSAMSAFFKSLTMDSGVIPHPVTLTVASQLNKQDAALWSGDLERDASLVINLSEIVDETTSLPIPGQRMVEVAFSRFSDVGRWPVYFNGAKSRVASMVPGKYGYEPKFPER